MSYLALMQVLIGSFFVYFLCTEVQANHSKGLHLQLSESNIIDFSFKDISDLHVFKTSCNHASVMLVLSPNAANKYARLTRGSVGTPVAWIWDGRVVGIEKLKAPLSKDLTIHHLTNQEAEDFRKAVTH